MIINLFRNLGIGGNYNHLRWSEFGDYLAAGKGTIKENMDDLRDILEDEIIKGKSSDEEKKKLLKRLRNFCDTETNIMLVGATGCGKSSTINALFACSDVVAEWEKDANTNGQCGYETEDSNGQEDREVQEPNGKNRHEAQDSNQQCCKEAQATNGQNRKDVQASKGSCCQDGQDRWETQGRYEYIDVDIDCESDDESEGHEKSGAYNIGRKYVEIAKVGTRTEPETKDIERYKIGNLVLWDTPGLGDGTEIDRHHKEVITELLREKNEDGEGLIDLILVILDGSSRDLGTSYKILNEVIIPELGTETNRILVALNQSDIAMKNGRHWDFEKNEPDSVLLDFLKEKVESIKARIKEDSNIDISPIYYCAGYEEPEGDIVRPYNMSKLLYYIMESLPAQKRIAIMEGINTDSETYEYNDEDMDYDDGIKDSFYGSFDYISDGVDTGAEIGGTILGIPGVVIGGFIGGFVGCVRTIVDDIF